MYYSPFPLCVRAHAHPCTATICIYSTDCTDQNCCDACGAGKGSTPDYCPRTREEGRSRHLARPRAGRFFVLFFVAHSSRICCEVECVCSVILCCSTEHIQSLTFAVPVVHLSFSLHAPETSGSRHAVPQQSCSSPRPCLRGGGMRCVRIGGRERRRGGTTPQCRSGTSREK